MVAVNKIEISRDNVKRLLRELFQFDAQDLDFGIYRILNFRRKEIELFIEKDLIEAVEAEFKEYAKAGVVELQREVEKLKAEINRDFGEGTIDAQGHVVKNEGAPKVQEYARKAKELESAEVSEAQMNEVFNHVYEFFSRYYDGGDFISKRRYGGRDKYYLPYNGEEVVLYWANKDQYYVKTADYFRNYHFKVGGYRVNFLIREAEIEVNDVVGENKYFVLCDSDFIKVDEEKKVVDIYFEWRALTDQEKRKFGKRNVQDTLVKDAFNRITSETSDSNVGNLLWVKKNGEKTDLEKHLNNYVRRNTTDYFIHKNLKAFLERELEFYIKNEVADLDGLESLDERSLRIVKAKVKAIREISRKIIEFLAQIEDFQKMLFEKKKFITGTEYVITLDRIKEYAGEEFLESITDEILKNTEQLEEWKERLGIEVKNKNDLVERQTFDGKEWKKLPIDTRYFGINFKIRLLEALSEKNDLDEILDGILIKSENWQALNLLLNKFREQVQCIYIDPPFNTGTNEFLYKNNYLNSSWLSMMYDRLEFGKKLLKKDGSIYVRIDYHGNFYVRMLMNEIFGEGNFRNEIIVNRTSRLKSEGKKYYTSCDSIYFYTKADNYYFNEQKIEEPFEIKLSIKENIDEKKLIEFLKNYLMDFDYKISGRKLLLRNQKWVEMHASSDKEDNEPIKVFGKLYKPPKKRRWMWKDPDTLKKLENLGWVRINPKNNLPELLRTWRHLGSDWTDIPGYAQTTGFKTENAEILVKRLIETGSNENDLIMDFFLGSGTTAAVAHKLGRKWIGVEMGDYFDNIPLKRMKAVLAGEQSGISKDVVWKGGGFFKYHYVEQYEDALNSIVFREKDKTIQETLESFKDYFLRYMLDYETRDSPTRLNVEKFQIPFDYKIHVTFNGEEKPATVDLVETFNYLLGINVEKFRTFKDNNLEYRAVFGKKKDETIIIIWRNSKDLDLKRDKEFIENTILLGTKPDRIFINGDSLVEKAEPIEPEFKKLMEA